MGPVEIASEREPQGGLRCAHCHDRVEPECDACPDCGNSLHPRCTLEVGACRESACPLRLGLPEPWGPATETERYTAALNLTLGVPVRWCVRIALSLGVLVGLGAGLWTGTLLGLVQCLVLGGMTGGLVGMLIGGLLGGVRDRVWFRER